MEIGDQAIAIDSDWLEKERQWANDFGGKQLRVALDRNGEITASLDGRTVTIHRMFWFAWYSFHTNTALIDGN
jgi:hypothetical protein